jgi:hypothetical protein
MCQLCELMETVVRILCKFKQFLVNEVFISEVFFNGVFFARQIKLVVRFIMVSVFMLSANQLLAEEQGESGADPAQLEDVQEEWSEAIDSIKGYSVNQREAAVEKAGIELEKLDERIDVLKQRTADEWDTLSAETRAARLAALQELTVQRNELAEWYGGMKHSSSQAWVEVREGFVDAYDILQDAWGAALEEFE